MTCNRSLGERETISRFPLVFQGPVNFDELNIGLGVRGYKI